MKNYETKQKLSINRENEKKNYYIRSKKKKCSYIPCLKPKLDVQSQAAMMSMSPAIKNIDRYKTPSSVILLLCLYVQKDKTTTNRVF